jgi:hypothetical protein
MEKKRQRPGSSANAPLKGMHAAVCKAVDQIARRTVLEEGQLDLLASCDRTTRRSNRVDER